MEWDMPQLELESFRLEPNEKGTKYHRRRPSFGFAAEEGRGRGRPGFHCCVFPLPCPEEFCISATAMASIVVPFRGCENGEAKQSKATSARICMPMSHVSPPPTTTTLIEFQLPFSRGRRRCKRGKFYRYAGKYVG